MGTQAVLGRSAGAQRVETYELDSLYRQYAPVIFRRCLSLLGEEADALDALQDVFVKLFDGLRSFRGDAEILTWIYRIATNVCLNRIRRGEIEKRIMRNLSPEESSDPRDRLENRLLLHQLLKRLSPDRVQLLIYVHYDGLSQDQIAQILGVSSRTIRKRLSAIEDVVADLAPQLEKWRTADD